ncbi:hypothetical protein 2016_scaffold57_00059 [Bacteriophage sp.]|nr:hypothetical protein 2016_scaffold57_00059 [Bacteriophage sp.]
MAAVVVVDAVDFLLRKHLDFKLDNIAVLVLETLRAGSGNNFCLSAAHKIFQIFLSHDEFSPLQ